MSTSDGPEGSDSSGEDTEAATPEEERHPETQAESAGASEATEPEVTPQSAALRRQQYAVGVGAAIIAGFALAISSLQHFPDLPESVPLVAGFVGAGLVYWIVQRSLFPTESERSASE